MIESTRNVTITCDRPDNARHAGACKPLAFTGGDSADAHEVLAREGWTERDGKTFCSLHDPDLAGTVIALAPRGEYTHLGRGVWVRDGGGAAFGSLPQLSQLFGPSTLEVQLREQCAEPEAGAA